MITIQDLIHLAKYFSIISHSDGRIRLRISSSIKKEADNFDANIMDYLKDIDGIADVKLKKLIGSVTISYDKDIFAPKLWEKLISNTLENEDKQYLEKLIGGKNAK